jgi:hypothetical protein
MTAVSMIPKIRRVLAAHRSIVDDASVVHCTRSEIIK